MYILLQALGAAVVVSIVALIGITTLLLRESMLKQILFILVGFSAGGLMGGAFFHILPEALETISEIQTFILVLVGFSVFFLLERVIHWHHWHHKEELNHIHPYVFLNLVGDAIHNFVDGLIIIAAFSANTHLGILTTAGIVLHEIPQEMGDFGVMIHGGFSVRRALFWNFITALTSLVGVMVGYFLISQIEPISVNLLPFAAGGFIYIAASDLIPEIHREENIKKSLIAFLFFLIGVTMMGWLKMFLE